MWAVSPRFYFGIALEGWVRRSIAQEGAIGVLLEPALVARGYTLVRTRVTAAGRGNLQVMVERSDDMSMTALVLAVSWRLFWKLRIRS